MTTHGPTFIDRFNFHLAEHLLGQKCLGEFGIPSSNHVNASEPLYWRSKIALENSKMLPDEVTTTERFLFVDVTFDLKLHDDKSLHLTAQFGCFLLNEPTSQYVKGGILTLAQLEEHAQGVGIDLHSAPPKAFSQMMAGALLNTAKTTAKVRRNHLDLSLYYVDVNECGVLSMDMEATTSQFDALGVSLLVKKMVEGSSIDDIKKEEGSPQSFDTWFEQVYARFLEQSRSDHDKLKQPSTRSTSSSSRNDKEPPAAQQVPKRPAPQAYRIAIVPNKRRKKSKLSFAKQG
jgi:hypothetical protein